MKKISDVMDVFGQYNCYNKLDLNKKIISFIICHNNKPDLLFLTLDKLNNSSYNNFEVIVVDNNSNNNLKPLFINNINFKFPIKLIPIENNKNNIKYISIHMLNRSINKNYIEYLL